MSEIFQRTIVGSGVICSLPCKIHTIIPQVNADTHHIEVRDGTHDTDKIIFGLELGYYTSGVLILRYPILMRRGIYIKVSSSAIRTFIQYEIT